MERWLKLFESPNPVVRDPGASAILDRGDAAPLPILLEILDELHDHGLGAKAERVLLTRRDAALLPEMIARLRSPSPFVRQVACTVLGELRDRSATPHLLAALGDNAVMVRRAAAYALAKVADPASAPALLHHYRTAHEEINVRMALEAALDALAIRCERHPV